MLVKLSQSISRSIRSTAAVLDSFAFKMENFPYWAKEINRHQRVMAIGHNHPILARDIFIAPNATVAGKVNIGNRTSVWHNAVLRGDVCSIVIGSCSSIGPQSIIHGQGETKHQPEISTVIGDWVTIEPGSIIHGCQIQDECVIGMGSVILEGATIEKNSIIAPGSLITRGTIVKSGEFWAGSPATFIRSVTDEEIEDIVQTAKQQYESARELEKSFSSNDPETLEICQTMTHNKLDLIKRQ
eukprot:TRINITY_DN62_c1_g1_i1.p1 TRINITY_DN62_c1_g1~~TRINITY_DN62_c1_g1_i1.p1  ORF type:complete len:242 (-),score=105.60 TRINITY_DN62_c1_g1_i1:104-829(-)